MKCKFMVNAYYSQTSIYRYSIYRYIIKIRYNDKILLPHYMREHINIDITIFFKDFHMNPDISLYRSLTVNMLWNYYEHVLSLSIKKNINPIWAYRVLILLKPKLYRSVWTGFKSVWKLEPEPKCLSNLTTPLIFWNVNPISK